MPPYPGLTSSKVTEWLSYGGNKLTKYQKRNEVSVLFKYLFGLNKSFKDNCFVSQFALNFQWNSHKNARSSWNRVSKSIPRGGWILKSCWPCHFCNRQTAHNTLTTTTTRKVIRGNNKNHTLKRTKNKINIPLKIPNHNNKNNLLHNNSINYHNFPKKSQTEIRTKKLIWKWDGRKHQLENTLFKLLAPSDPITSKSIIIIIIIIIKNPGVNNQITFEMNRKRTL